MVIFYALAASALAWAGWKLHELSSGIDFTPKPDALVFISGQGANNSADLLRTRTDWMNALDAFDKSSVEGIAYREETGSRVAVADRQGSPFSIATPFDTTYCQPGYGTLGGNGQVYFKKSTSAQTTKATLDKTLKAAGYTPGKNMMVGQELHVTYTRLTAEPGLGDLYTTTLDLPLNSTQRGNVSSKATQWQIVATISPTMVQLSLPREPCYPLKEVPKSRDYTVTDLKQALDFYRWEPGYPAQSFDQVTRG